MRPLRDLTEITIPLPKNVEIGRLIGSKGCNLKPITSKTGTYIHVESKTNTPHIKVTIKKNGTDYNRSVEARMDEAKDLLNDLIKNTRRKKVFMTKKEDDTRFLDNDKKHLTRRYQKEINAKKERVDSNREINEEIVYAQQVRFFASSNTT